MALATVTTKGQITLPKQIRESLKLSMGDKIEIVTINRMAALIRPISKKVDDIFCKLHNPERQPVSPGRNRYCCCKPNEKEVQMKALDINILIRFLVGDDNTQAQAVYNLLKDAESKNEQFFVPLLVVLELVWFLESVYLIERKEVIDSISDLLAMPVLKFDRVEAIQNFLIAAKNSSYDLSDLLIAHLAKNFGCETVYTFDKKASIYALFELLQ